MNIQSKSCPSVTLKVRIKLRSLSLLQGFSETPPCFSAHPLSLTNPTPALCMFSLAHGYWMGHNVILHAQDNEVYASVNLSCACASMSSQRNITSQHYRSLSSQTHALNTAGSHNSFILCLHRLKHLLRSHGVLNKIRRLEAWNKQQSVGGSCDETLSKPISVASINELPFTTRTSENPMLQIGCGLLKNEKQIQSPHSTRYNIVYLVYRSKSMWQVPFKQHSTSLAHSLKDNQMGNQLWMSS